ncbi:hypothetical protein BDV96DRAFT_264521 [Lophiotrema nucula]|uniref:Cora-like Mg2+ transporter protein-domain-containing protein n=1 Tax=Lophiotrema nucula TaxID=690887 RepID=A0A6A5YPQ0_9PLEO|nr:hypothetical protein BDV96DRAFT_264521 [Lophiotrema nucula]
MPTTAKGRLACENSQIIITELHAPSTERSVSHWTLPVSVESLLYDQRPLSEILNSVRPTTFGGQRPHCLWFHVPENNLIWVEDLFLKLEFPHPGWNGITGCSDESPLKRGIPAHARVDENFTSAFVPFLSYEKNTKQYSRQNYVQRTQRHDVSNQATLKVFDQSNSRSSKNSSVDRNGPEPEPVRNVNLDWMAPNSMLDSDGLDEEEKCVIDTYLNNPPALHIRKTLDQYFYHMLESTSERDQDQVVSRWARRVRKQMTHNILMVDQLWIWQCMMPGRNGLSAIVTAFPGRTGVGSSTERTYDDLRARVLARSGSRKYPIQGPHHLVGRILATCFGLFDDLQGQDMLRFMAMFEDSIGTIDNRESELFKKFEKDSTSLQHLSKKSYSFDDHRRTLLEQLLDIQQETKLLIEIKDIRDEIKICLSIVDIQKQVFAQMSDPNKGGKFEYLDTHVRSLLESTQYAFNRINVQAEAVQDKLNTLMDLKQKASNAWEARSAREVAVEAGKQGNTMLVFTIVTIIFLPLSFMSSFFALSIASFPKDQASGQTNWPLGLVSGYLFGISLLISIPLIVIAMNVQIFASLLRNLTHNHLVSIAICLIKFVPTFGSSNIQGYLHKCNVRLHKRRHVYFQETSWSTGIECKLPSPLELRAKMDTKFSTSANVLDFDEKAATVSAPEATESRTRNRARQEEACVKEEV